MTPAPRATGTEAGKRKGKVKVRHTVGKAAVRSTVVALAPGHPH